MAKGKRKAKSPKQHHDEDGLAKAERGTRAKAPQAKPHKRGGVHKVKDQHLTGTKWDLITRDQMVQAALRDPKYIQFFASFKEDGKKVKDLKKETLLQTLGNAEIELGKRALEQKKEIARLRKEAEKKIREEAKQKKIEQQRKEEDRLRREEEGQIVSEEESEQEHFQLYLQQEGSDVSDTTTTEASDSPVYSPQVLRIFEWSFADPPASNYQRTPRTWPQKQELMPRQLPYTPMNVVTMNEHEMLHTPGIDNKEQEVDPESVPVLSLHVIECARNGVLTGPLAGGIIESGMDWAARTLVQGWNGRMYFHLPRAEADLAEVYRQWKSREATEKRRLDRKQYRGIPKVDPRLKALRRKEQRKLTKNVYKATEWRPTLVYLPVYLPAYFEPPTKSPADKLASMQTIETLFYVRLRDETVPSFFFWVEEDGWGNPTEPNPEYEKYSDQRSHRSSLIAAAPQRRLSRLIRVKRLPAPRRFSPTVKITQTSQYNVALWSIERDLYNHGLQSTLQSYHNKWKAEGKEDVWMKLTKWLRRQRPPSGILPPHPPVRVHRDPSMISIAEKMARVEAPSPHHPTIPIYINDDWTRNDDAYWTTEERPKTPGYDALDTRMQYATLISRSGRPACSRPGTPATPQSLERRISDVFASLSTVTHLEDYNLPTQAELDEINRLRNETFDDMVEPAPPLPFSPGLWTMMQERYRWQVHKARRCALCFDEVDRMSQEEYQRHLQNHVDDIALRCPFCRTDWELMDGDAKAHHVRGHAKDTYSPTEIPNPVDSPYPAGDRIARVRFAQQAAAQRTRYNDRFGTRPARTAPHTGRPARPSNSQPNNQDFQPDNGDDGQEYADDEDWPTQPGKPPRRAKVRFEGDPPADGDDHEERDSFEDDQDGESLNEEGDDPEGNASSSPLPPAITSSDDDDDDDEDNDEAGGQSHPGPNPRPSSHKSSSPGQKSSSSGNSAFGPAANPPSFSRTSGWPAWPVSVPLWYNLIPNPAAQQETEDDEQSAEEEDEEDPFAEPPEVVEGLGIDDVHALMSVKKGTRPHIPRDQRLDRQANGKARLIDPRSAAPSPSSSLAQAEKNRRKENAPPNAPSNGINESSEGPQGQMPQWSSAGQLSHTPSAGGQASKGSSATSKKRKSSSSGSDIPAAKRLKTRIRNTNQVKSAGKATSAGSKGGKKRVNEPPRARPEEASSSDEDEDEAEDEYVEDEEETEESDLEEVPAAARRSSRIAKVASMQGKQTQAKKAVPAKKNAVPAKKNAALAKKAAPATKKPAKTAKKGTAKAAAVKQPSDAQESSESEPSSSIDSGEEPSEYQPRLKSGRNAKKGGNAAKKSNARVAKQGKKAAPAVAKKGAPARRRLTEAERLAREAQGWTKW